MLCLVYLYILNMEISEEVNKQIVSIKNHDVDMAISDNMIYLGNDDVPGVIGAVGATLGKEKGSPNILICVFCFNNRR